MDNEDLIKTRESFGFNITQMAIALNTPRGTYLKWERGERRVPGIVDVAIKSLIKSRPSPQISNCVPAITTSG